MAGYVYNGVFVQLSRTLAFEWEQERDPSNTDALWDVYTIRVAGFVSTQDNFRGDTATVLAAIKSALETPRRGVQYTVGGTVLVDVGGGFGPQLDAKLGPEPSKASVRAVTSGTFFVECGCVVRVVSCDSSPTNPSPVVSLRWSQSEGFDQDWVGTLSTQGKLIVRSDLLTSADFFRPLATPPVPKGYIRTRSSYTLNPSGLELDFAFDDVEQDTMPPNECTRVAGHFTLHVDKGYHRKGEVEVTIQGPPGANRNNLVVRALGVCYARLSAEAPPAPRVGKGFHLISGSVTVDMVKPIVTGRMNCILAPLPVGPRAGALAAWVRPDSLLSTPGMSSGAWAVGLAGPAADPIGIAPPTRKVLGGLLTALFRDPCLAGGT